MNIIVPEYLKNIVFNEEFSDCKLKMNIKCKCDCIKFNILKNKQTEDFNNKKNEWNDLLKEHGLNPNIYSNDKGEVFIQKKGFCGIGKKITKIDMKSVPKEINIIKLLCFNCGNEYIIFDNRIHGYDAITENNKINQDYSDIVFQNKINDSEVFLKIIYSLTYEEFNDGIEQKLSYETYTNAFSDITITAKKDNKNIKVHSEETA